MQPDQLLVGPVIGKVTETTARVLIEVAQQGTYTCFLSDPSGGQLQCQNNFASEKPNVFQFKGLKPGTKYKVVIQNMKHVASSFKTLGDNSQPLSFAFVSCDDIEYGIQKNKDSNLWTDLARNATQNKIDYILHMGDNVYMDSGTNNGDEPYHRISKML